MQVCFLQLDLSFRSGPAVLSAGLFPFPAFGSMFALLSDWRAVPDSWKYILLPGKPAGCFCFRFHPVGCSVPSDWLLTAEVVVPASECYSEE